MGFANRSTIRYFFLWLLIVPYGLYYVFINFPPVHVNWSYIVILTTLSLLTVYFPIMGNGSPVFLVMWLTVPAFLMYGLFVEIIIMQIAILAILFSVRSPLTLPIRFFFNSILFFILSIIGAFTFNMMGGEIGSFRFWPVFLSVFAYQLTHTFVNDWALRLYLRYKKNSTIYSTKEIVANYGVVLVIVPLSLTLYFMIGIVGIGAFLLVGIPFFFITLVVRLYNNSEKINEYLRQTGDIGQEISTKMTEKEVIDQFVIKTSEMFHAEYVYLFDFKDDWLELIRSYEHHKFMNIDFARLTAGQGLAGTVLQNNKPIIYSTREEWVMVSKNYAPDELQSVLCVPITRNQQIEAVLLLGSQKKSAFEDYQLKILDLLCSYFTVSVEKARYMQEAVTKNERCALTGLYNFRFLEDKLNREMALLKNNVYRDLSVVMLDIDHFKTVNDTYGHQSGNDILCMLARKLEAALPAGGTIGRYGGEEFVYILPGISKAEAVDFAENLRAEIDSYDFAIIPDLTIEKDPLVIHITSSIGVSSAPEDTDEAMSLLRNVDRALYVGAKQAGRNRVAEYAK